MKKTIYIQPRQTGKTYNAIQLAKRVKGKVLFLCYNVVSASEIRDKLPEEDRSRITIGYFTKLADSVFTDGFDLVVIDEFMHCYDDMQINLYKTLTKHKDKINQLVMYSTPSRYVDKVLFNKISLYKTNIYGEYRNCKANSYTSFRDKLILLHLTTRDEVKYWYNSFMTDDDTNLVMDTFYYSPYTDNELIQQLGTDAFNLEYKLNMFKIDD